MTFLATAQQSYLYIRCVREVRWDDEDLVTLILDDGSQRKACREEWLRAERNSTWQVSSAAPGTYALNYCVHANGDLSVVREPVVAWALGGDGVVYPVTPDGVHSDIYDPLVVRFPDGSVRYADESYDNEHQWLANIRDERAKVGA